MSSGPGSSQPGRVARAATRYRPGKAPVAADDQYSSSSDSDDEKKQERRVKRQKGHQDSIRDEPISDISKGVAALKDNQRRTAGVIIQSNGGIAVRKPVVKLDDVQIGAVKKQKLEEESELDSDEYETDTDEEIQQVKSKPVFKKPVGTAAAAAASQVERKESSSEYETDSEEDEESEEDSRPAMLKPIFVSKRQRELMKEQNGGVEESDGSKEKATQSHEEELDEVTLKAQRIAQERRKQSHMLAAETIKREIAEKEHEEGQPDLSDTDGKDPEEEFQAWRIRELSRLKAEREAMKEKEAEREEIERRRAMPEAERLAEDTKRAEASREEKRKAKQQEGKSGGGASFMQKYHHKGSFFADDELLKSRDAMAKTESAVDISLLPKVMQVRDYGKAGRSKWTHLSNEDTSRKQEDHRMRGISGSDPRGNGHRQESMKCFTCRGPHLRRDCPNQQQQQQHGNGHDPNGREARGANSVPIRDERHRRDQRRSRSPIDRRKDDLYRRERAR